MVLVSRSVQPQACRQFEAEILVLHHPTTIRLNYQVSPTTANVVQSGY